FIDWIAALRHAGLNPATLQGAGLPFLGTLLKKEQDFATFERQARRGTGRRY
ncbi:MAG TPA: MoxR family ATPase, partial [Nannocystis exedens]|nr:MoxR family ATPase [Nannocystis exedens]